jgi:competence protein ComEA
VKHAPSRQLIRNLFGSFALFFVGVCGITLWLLNEVSVSARQSASNPANQASAKDAQPDHPEFPPGDGREAVLRICSKCHSPTIVLAYGQKREAWENTITKMVRLGATGSDEDFTDIADYLTTNFPPSAVPKIFVNKATDQQIASVLEIGLDQAKAITAYRDKVGGFKSIEDMKKVPNVDAGKIEAKKESLVF